MRITGGVSADCARSRSKAAHAAALLERELGWHVPVAELTDVGWRRRGRAATHASNFAATDFRP
jgi:hypothetical protein